jgi:Non-classical export protein 1
MADLEVCIFIVSLPTITRLTNTSNHRFFDPVFSICVGISAAALRIQREEKEKYPEQKNDFGALWIKGVGMSRNYFKSDQDSK